MGVMAHDAQGEVHPLAVEFVDAFPKREIAHLSQGQQQFCDGTGAASARVSLDPLPCLQVRRVSPPPRLAA
jgi:hypothetical protein